jgi:predicted RNA-binding protein YlqC (UPF0109 family)
MAASIDQQFIEYIVKSLVGKPDEVKVERRIDEKGVLLELTVDPEDLGRVIGKRGSTAQSLRTLLRALGTKNDARYNLKIVDTGPPPEKRYDSEDAVPTASKPAVKPADEDSTAADDQTVSDEIEEPRNDENTASENDDDLPKPASKEDHDDVISRTRKELADLDDLDV